LTYDDDLRNNRIHLKLKRRFQYIYVHGYFEKNVESKMHLIHFATKYEHNKAKIKLKYEHLFKTTSKFNLHFTRLL